MSNETKTPLIAPVQGYVQGIPWEMHLRAYNEYCQRFSPQVELITGGCRGGFHVSELDMFIPGWRDELDDRKKLELELAAATQKAEALRKEIKAVLVLCPYAVWVLHEDSFDKNLCASLAVTVAKMSQALTTREGEG